MTKKRKRKHVKGRNKKSKVDRQKTFLHYLSEKQQKIDLLFFLVAYIIIYIFLYVTYPYPPGTADSGSYILSAMTMKPNGFRPIGYSWFLNFFHQFSHHIKFLPFSQYLLNCVATLFFLFTIKYFFNPKKAIFYVFSFFLIFSPSIIFCTNYIMSDSVFNTLTLLYITTGFWIIKKKNGFMLLLHLAILYLAFNVRYVAVFYLVVLPIILIIYHRRNKWIIIPSVVIPLLLGVIHYQSTKNTMRKLFGINTYSGFSGWALANNAVSMIPHINLNPDEIEDEELRMIHNIITLYPDSVYHHRYINGTSFIWKKEFAGKRVLFYNMQNKKMNYVKAWIYTGEQFQKYGLFLIKKYPLKFFRYFIFPNMTKIFVTYNIFDPTLFEPYDVMIQYYGVTDKYEYKFKIFSSLFLIRRMGTFLLWCIFFGSIILLILKRKDIDLQGTQKQILFFILVFIFLYLAFSILTHPINNYRYLIPLFALQLCVPGIILNEVLKIRDNKQNIIS